MSKTTLDEEELKIPKDSAGDDELIIFTDLGPGECFG
jgi:hypothetical protein